MSFTSEIRATKFVFPTLFEFTRMVHSFCCVCVECFIGINHHSFNCFSTLNGIGSATHTTRTMWSSAVCLKNVCAEICSSRSHFRPFFCWTCNNELFSDTAKDRSFRFHGSPTQALRNSLSRESLPESRLTTRLISAPRGVNRMDKSFFFLPADTHVFHRSSSIFSSASWFLNKRNSANFTSSLSYSLSRIFLCAVGILAL